MIEHIQLADLRTFVSIAEQGNFTKAAEKLQVSRSHVSRQISQLESQLGVTLLIRTTRTLKLTHEGQKLYQECANAFSFINQALLEAVENTETLSGDIFIDSVGGIIGEDIIATMAHEFMKLHPNVHIHLDFSSHRIDLIMDDIDIAFRMGELSKDEAFIAYPLMTIHMATLASPDYLQQHGRPIHPKDLIQHRCLTGSVNKWSFTNKTEDQVINITVPDVFRCKNGRVLVNGALHGNGIIRVPTLYCTEEIKQQNLEEVFNDWHIPSVNLSLIYQRDKYQPKRFVEFIQFTKAYFNNHINHDEKVILTKIKTTDVIDI